MAIRPSAGLLETAKSEQNITYIRQMLAELRAVAEAENADMLCYLIEMAYFEAGDLLGQIAARQKGGVERGPDQ